MPAGPQERGEVAGGRGVRGAVDPSLPALMRSEERPAGRGGQGLLVDL